MAIADRLPTLDDAALASLRANAARLQAGGGAKQEEAAMLLPLIEAEIAEREARKPPKPVRAPGPRRPSKTRRG
jgi:hypothetical protein